MIKIATWNVNSLTVRLPQLLTWMNTAQPDIIALQETKIIDDKFPKTSFTELGYHVVYSGQKTYNGVAIVSKEPIDAINTDIPEFLDPQRRILAATINGIRVINLYVPNGASVGSEKYDYKLTWLTHINKYLKEQLNEHDKLVVLGDFNIAPAAEDVYNPVAWEDHVLFSEHEREAFAKLLKLGLHDSFRLFTQAPGSYTWWDYRAGSFWRNHGLRIDHILVSETLAKNCQGCEIDKSLRKQKPPSDHTPVIATFAI